MTRRPMSKTSDTQAPFDADADDALRLLEDSLSYYTPVAPRKVAAVEYEDLPLAA